MSGVYAQALVHPEWAGLEGVERVLEKLTRAVGGPGPRLVLTVEKVHGGRLRLTMTNP